MLRARGPGVRARGRGRGCCARGGGRAGVLRARARPECCGWAGVGAGELGLDRVRVDWDQG